jgi:hypothetical protein
MQDFSGGVNAENAEQYERWLRDHRYKGGLVVNLNKGRKGKWTYHKAECGFNSYNLQEKGQSGRSGKVCFDNRAELRSWLEDQDMEMDDLNPCYKCI